MAAMSESGCTATCCHVHYTTLPIHRDTNKSLQWNSMLFTIRLNLWIPHYYPRHPLCPRYHLKTVTKSARPLLSSKTSLAHNHFLYFLSRLPIITQLSPSMVLLLSKGNGRIYKCSSDYPPTQSTNQIDSPCQILLAQQVT